jgi:hypothetical protein
VLLDLGAGLNIKYPRLLVSSWAHVEDATAVGNTEVRDAADYSATLWRAVSMGPAVSICVAVVVVEAKSDGDVGVQVVVVGLKLQN